MESFLYIKDFSQERVFITFEGWGIARWRKLEHINEDANYDEILRRMCGAHEEALQRLVGSYD